ncbi:GntR family transcriptional regulator [Aquibacillus sediminis]|uniref:GntR family transcriptional regulator n=1 Tax=Aquibacillus sediminis TaxID=2574734 RepID=UPI001109E282|nr:GntR family transcriptional regulator [Aquibacillus sediminis]
MISLNPESELPLYRQLTNQIMEAIVRDELATNDMLPSVRAFASDLGVNMHTVNKSYHELETKGIIKIVPKKGAIIIANKRQQITAHQLNKLGEAFQPLVVEALVNGISQQELQDLITKVLVKIKED